MFYKVYTLEELSGLCANLNSIAKKTFMEKQKKQKEKELKNLPNELSRLYKKMLRAANKGRAIIYEEHVSEAAIDWLEKNNFSVEEVGYPPIRIGFPFEKELEDDES
jgi:hypothetical protein